MLVLVPALASLSLSVQTEGREAGPFPGTNPIELDRSGVPWTLSFSDALRGAEEQDRLLLVLADNYEPTDDGSFGFEFFRVQSLCDERVASLIERRFVPFYFNVFEHTAAHDPAALEFVMREKKQFGREEQTFYGGIPVLVMSAAGKLVAEFPSATPAEDVLKELRKVLKKNAKFNALSASEKEQEDAIERARLLLALGETDKARRELTRDGRPEAWLLLARLAREEQDWKAHARALQRVVAAELQADVALERAWGCLFQADGEQAVQTLAALPESGPRRAEALYVEGLAYHALAKDESALAAWKRLAESQPLCAWSYRADWAWCNVQQGDPSQWRDGMPPECTPLLGHGTYPGPRNPDLALGE